MTPTLASSPHESDSAEHDVVANSCTPPPPGYAIAALPDGRFLPMSVLLLSHENAAESMLSLCGLSWQNEIIPPARGDWPRVGSIICQTYTDAYSFCERDSETPHLLLDIERLAMATECYPDRNSCYRDEIERLLREADYCWQERGDGPFSVVTTTGGISTWIHVRAPTFAELHLHIKAANPDEMWEILYQAVFADCNKPACS